ncbi:MAG: HAD-IA family hydrolase [Gammaproteobacteria bacterium]|nr:HAD-IA family hydrolase [Gammaproteobacteria bacterium]
MTKNQSARAYDAVLLDLDGTLADTAPDLAQALNQTLRYSGKDTLPFSTIRPHVSQGGLALIKLGFGFDETHTDYAKTRAYLLQYYQQHIAQHTTLFDGMAELLATLENNAIPWGIVTNKPGYLTTPLVKALALDQRASCVVSGDTVSHSKPHPAPLLHACKIIGVQAQRCLYVGDAKRDIEAGHNAGMMTLAAAFGYIGEHDNVTEWGADGIINSAKEILDWIHNCN